MYFFSFLYGIIAAIIALFIQNGATLLVPNLKISSVESSTVIITLTLILFAFIEETTKFLAIRKEQNLLKRPKQTLLHALFVGIGFITVELALISLQTYSTNPFASLAIVGTLIIHLGTVFIITILSATGHTWSRWIITSIILTTTTLLHATYNILAFTNHSPTSLPQVLFLSLITIGTFTALITIIKKG